MPKIRIDLDATVINGQALTFKSPADCSQITGLIIYYPEGDTTISKDFKFVDAHGVDVGSGTISLFAADALVKVILDTDQSLAFVQNADTNAYLESRFSGKSDTIQHAAGEVISLDNSAAVPLHGLKLYGKTTQDGTPSPDAPDPFSSAG